MGAAGKEATGGEEALAWNTLGRWEGRNQAASFDRVAATGVVAG